MKRDDKNMDRTFFSTLVDDLRESVRFLDCDKRILYINPFGERLTGCVSEDILGRFCGDFTEEHTDKSGKRLCDTACPLDHVLTTGEIYNEHLYFRGKNGDVIPVMVRVLPAKDAEGRMIGLVEVMSDDRPRLESEELKRDIQRIIPVDILTGLYTREKILEFFEVKLENSRRYDAPLGVVMVVLQNSDKIRKRFGDKKLQEVIQRIGYLIRMNTRRGDVSGRLGPVEFLMLLPNANEGDTTMVAEKLERIIRDDSGLVLPERFTVITGSSQYATGDDIDSLIERARENPM
ncbi:MAG: diguanylate cyclase [Deltaproteobacteria bacterium]|nr:diguanylate cyclase [Candidatus Zymogenaceae bacterium]